MNIRKMARTGALLVSSLFLTVILASIGYTLVYGLDIGKMYKEHRAKQHLEELQKSGLTFLKYCEQQKLECTESIEHGDGYVARTAKVFYPIWEKSGETTGFRFGWENSQRVFNSEQAGYRSSENFWGAGPKFTWKSGSRDIPLPPTEPEVPPAK